MKASELVLANDGSLYHIHLTRDTLADNVLLVGDPERVNMFKEIFEKVEHESCNRELHALTGRYHDQRFTALSTGMGCDNIDIVMTELDAALHLSGNGQWEETTSRQLRLVRIGTSGSLQTNIDCGEMVASRYAIGLDGLMNYYREWISPLPDMEQDFLSHMGIGSQFARPYCAECSLSLLADVADGMHQGITVTAPGFYGPQGRAIRLHPSINNLNERLASYAYNYLPITNLEMETSAIYGFAHALHHEALTVCLIIANRPQGTFLSDYHTPMRSLVGSVVERMA